jgi:hypothetical protein
MRVRSLREAFVVGGRLRRPTAATTAFLCCCSGLLLVLAPSPALAQSGTATLRGTVNDTTGAVVPGATVTLLNQRTRDARNTTSDARGGYFFAAVVPGTYTVKVEIAGFKGHEQRGISISPADTRGVDVTLEVGQQAETITVTAEKEIIQTETGAREGVLTAEQIDNLSIIGRSSVELLRIMPGVVAPDMAKMETSSFGTGGMAGANDISSFAVNGVRGTNNTYSLDGSKMIDIGSNAGVVLSPNNDMVQEVKVQSSNYAAEYGSSGVHISAVTKGGGSKFHGTVYDYLRHNKFAANDRSNTIAGVAKPKSYFHYPGFNLSGPLLIPGTGFNKNRDKAFFFFGLEVQRQELDPGSRFSIVPSDRQREGDFSELLANRGQNLLQPTQVLIPHGFPGAGTPAAGNDLRPYIDPVGRALINLYPRANYNDPNNRFNYVYNVPEPVNRLEMSLRVDYNFTENTKAYIRLARQTEDLIQPRGLWWGPSDVELPSPNKGDNLGRSAALNLISVLSPTATNEVLVTWSRLNLDNDYEDPNKVSLEALGIGDFRGFFPRQTSNAPVSITSWGDQGLGTLLAAGAPLFAHNDSLQLSDTFTKVMNAHAIKVGFMVEQANKWQNFQNENEVQFEFAQWGQPGGTGSNIGDILVGRPVNVAQGTTTPNMHFRLWNIDGFVQDSWKIKPNFTFEYGVRLSKMLNNGEVNDYGAIFIPETYDRSQGQFLDGDITRLNGVSYVRLGQVPQGLTEARSLFVMPRVNFAWDIGGKGDTVLRGGAGVFYNRPQGNAEYDVLRFPPNSYRINVDHWGGESLGGGRGLTYDTLRLVDPFTRVGAQNLTSVNPDSIKYPRHVTTSLSLARRIPFQQVLEVAYVGTFGRNLLNRRMINVIPEGTFLQNQPGVQSDLTNPLHRAALDTGVRNTFRPFPAYGNIQFVEYDSESNYHSLQATLSRQTGKRLQYFATYTFSKALGTNANENGDQVDPFDARNRSYGILPYDRTHVANLSYNYMLPDTGSSSGFVRALLDGWQISGISTLSSGVPIKPRFDGALAAENIATAWAGTPALNQNRGSGATGVVAPTYRGNPQLPGKDVGEKLLDINALGIPAFGESGPYIAPFYLRSPSRHFHDVTLFKNFKLGGERKLQFRAGFFNIFNQAFASPFVVNDIDLRLDTQCNVNVADVPNGAGGTTSACDPRGGFSFTPQTIENFGKINLLRGHRVIELALKLYF